MKTIAEFLVFNASRYPEKIALVYKDLRLTFHELNQRTNRLAHHLLDLGVKKGDRVGFMFYNSNQFSELYYATQKIGAIAVPLNFRLVPREVKWILDNARCKVFAYSEACAKQVEPVKNEFATIEYLIYSGANPPSGEKHFETLTREGDSKEPNTKVELEDRSVILYTGGTTGFPKGALHINRSIVFGTMAAIPRMRFVDNHVVQVNQLPMFHVGGLTLLNQSIACGGKFVMIETFDPLEILKMIDREKATFLFLLPPQTYVRLLDVPNLKDFDTTSVTTLGGSTGAFTKPLLLRLFDAFPNADILSGYGMSESLGGIYGWINRSMVEEDLERIKSLGTETLLGEYRLVDDKNQEVSVGETGEAITRGIAGFVEYFDQPDLTAQAIKDGWYHTGDLLRKDAEGFYYFMDRKKDMIKSGGENVFAQEVEGVILSHPAVEMCAVIGVPDPVFSEAVMAVIKLRPGFSATKEEITEHCKQHLSSYKKPRRIAFVEEFPMSDAGKVQKFKLKEQYSKP